MVKVVEQVEPQKRKRYNKNKKKAWRKKTNISEVEEQLEEERREERYGGPLENREDKELLFLDTGNETTSTNTQLKDEKCSLEYTLDKIPEDAESTGIKKNIQLKPSSRQRRVTTLKSHQFLSGFQGAKTPHKPQVKRSTMSVAMKKKAQIEAKNPKVAKKCKETVKQIEKTKDKNAKRPKNSIRSKFNFDIWAEGADDVTQECVNKGLEQSFIKDISDYYRTERKIRPIKAPKNRLVQVTKLKAVQEPKGGISYNPAYDEHQKLMQEALAQEEIRDKKIRRVERVTTKMFPTIDKAPTEATWLQEMSQGLPSAGNEDDEESEEEKEVDEQQLTVTYKAKNEKKTKKQRKKEEKQKAAVRKRQREKEERIRNSNVFRIKTYQKEIENSENLTKKRIATRIARKEEQKFMPQRLGKMKFIEEDIAVPLGDELPDCLRRVKPAVSLIAERFKNLQRRNMLEPRLPSRMKRKYKLKKSVKRSYKEEFEKIEKMEFIE